MCPNPGTEHSGVPFRTKAFSYQGQTFLFHLGVSQFSEVSCHVWYFCLFVVQCEQRSPFSKVQSWHLVPGKCMIFLVCSWQLHKEVSHALSCQELFASLKEYQSEGYRAAFPESCSDSALPQSPWFQSSTKHLQPASPHLMCMKSMGVAV